MSAKHTPVPWVLGRTSEDKRLILGGPHKRYVASVTIHQIPRHMGLDDEPEREANVNLILAAPGLLEAAEKAMGWINDTWDGGKEAKDALRAAIIHATGATP